VREGGVEFLNQLLVKVVPPDLETPDTANVREWTFRDIIKMPKATQQEWKQVCRKELDSLHRHKVFELVDPPKGHKVIKNRWVFDLKSDSHKKAALAWWKALDKSMSELGFICLHSDSGIVTA
jgi:hypothetical protein